MDISKVSKWLLHKWVLLGRENLEASLMDRWLRHLRSGIVTTKYVVSYKDVNKPVNKVPTKGLMKGCMKGKGGFKNSTYWCLGVRHQA